MLHRNIPPLPLPFPLPPLFLYSSLLSSLPSPGAVCCLLNFKFSYLEIFHADYLVWQYVDCWRVQYEAQRCSDTIPRFDWVRFSFLVSVSQIYIFLECDFVKTVKNKKLCSSQFLRVFAECSCVLSHANFLKTV